jgi:hypothetical protein
MNVCRTLMAGFCLALTVALCSCNREYKTVNAVGIAEKVYALSPEEFDKYKHAELSIRNTTAGDAVFYLTPVSSDLFNDSAILKSALRNCTTAREKCIALWRFVSDWSYHSKPSSSADPYIHGPELFFNGFESGYCDDRNTVLANLAAAAGIKARVCNLPGHVVAELYYNNEWHLFDADKNIYYTKPDGEVADMAYLRAHPETITEAGKTLKTAIAKWRNRQTRKAIEANTEAIVEVRSDIQNNYSSALTLKPGDRITFTVSRAGFLAKTIEATLLEKGGPLYQREGKLISAVNFDAYTEAGNKKEIIFEQRMPYPVSRVSVRANSAAMKNKTLKIFYSVDGRAWYYQGTLSNNSAIAFTPCNEYGAAFTFSYFVKAIAMEGEDIARGRLVIENNFSFSDKILFNNPGHGFRIVPLNEAAKKQAVNLSVHE